MAAMVAISMFALLGMLVLVVDVGGMLTLRRRMVGGVDAAALASAQSCARQMAGEARSEADSIAALNQSNVVNTSYSTDGCGTKGSGSVSLSYRAPIGLSFAPVLGLPSESRVSASAKAVWGPAGGAKGMPLAINLGTSQTDRCDIPNIAPGTECYVWFDNDRQGQASWGWANLNQWGVSSSTKCTPDSQALRDYIDAGGYTGSGDLTLSYPDPTYVCADHGLRSSNFDSLKAWAGHILLFPMNDPSGAVPPGTAGKIDKFDIVGFVALRLIDVYKANEVGASSGSCGPVAFDFRSQPSLDLDGLSCISGAPVDDISGLSLTDASDGRVTYQLGVHYTYDSSTDVVTWIAAPPANPVDVGFSWTRYGICGEPPGNASARCLVTRWEGAQVGGSLPGGGKDFGLRAIKLSD